MSLPRTLPPGGMVIHHRPAKATNQNVLRSPLCMYSGSRAVVTGSDTAGTATESPPSKVRRACARC